MTGKPISSLDDDVFVLEQVTIEDDSDDDFEYENVLVEQEFSESEGEENLEQALRIIQEKSILDRDTASAAAAASGGVDGDAAPPAKLTRSPEVVDDFIRNFLVKQKMLCTLETFETEWYALSLNENDDDPDAENSRRKAANVPDVYQENLQLNQHIQQITEELTKCRSIIDRTQITYSKLVKERDYHRMHHKRVVQEKSRLHSEYQKLKRTMEEAEPSQRSLRNKYEAAMKERMLLSLERDRLDARLSDLEMAAGYNAATNQSKDGAVAIPDKSFVKKASSSVERSRDVVYNSDELDVTKQPIGHPNDSQWPIGVRVNPYSAASMTPAEAHTFRAINVINAHEVAISSLALHPTKQLLASGSDDHSWSMWTIPTGELVMTGKGHTDWIGDCTFHPGGGHLATGSGDTTVKIWDFAKTTCTATFSTHKLAVWGVQFHDSGDFLASCSMDHSTKVWDMNSGRCRQTLRGHADSVNALAFQPYTNNLCTASGDKTVSLWDARTGICEQTFYGHTNACTSVTFSKHGDLIASTDADGFVRLWDIRALAELGSINMGPHAANKVAFDSAGAVIAVAMNDATIKLYDLVSKAPLSDLTGHDDAVQSVVFSYSSEFLISASSDATVRIWGK